jgi:hypothetical protein
MKKPALIAASHAFMGMNRKQTDATASPPEMVKGEDHSPGRYEGLLTGMTTMYCDLVADDK